MLAKASRKNLFKGITNYFFVIAIILIIFSSVFSYYQFKKLLKAADRVQHTYQVMITAQQVLENITRIESMQRGYLLFNDLTYKAEYENTINFLQSALVILSKLVSDNPTQLNRASEIRELVSQRIQVYAQISTLHIENKKHKNELSSLITESKMLSTLTRNAINNFIREENLLLELRNDTEKNEIKFNNMFLLFGGSISTVFLIIAFISLNRSQKEINSKEKQLRGIINGAKDIIVVVDPKMRFLVFNEAFRQEFLKLFRKEVKIGMTFQEALSNAPQSKELVLNIWKESLEAEKPYSKYIELDLNGQVFSYEINSSKLYDDYQFLGAVQITRNITERVKEQHALEKANAQLQEAMAELKDKNEKITILLEMSDLLLAANSLAELSTITTRYAKRILDFSSGYSYIMHPSKNMLQTDSSWGNPESRTKQFTPDDCWALRLGRIHQYIKTTDLICAHAQENIFYICVPLRAQNDIFGVLYIEFDVHSSRTVLENNDKLIISAFAEVTALSLANITLRENLRFQSIRDPLTTLYNRRYLEEFLTKLIAQSERNNQPISILMLDLDHFKRINDVHGHDAGDMVLKEFSKILLKEIREGDIAARFGGEEFILILYNTDLDTAYTRADAIRTNISSLSLKYGTDFIGKITVSIGISSYPRDGFDKKSLIEIADKALYTAKNTGRNKVVGSESIITAATQENLTI